jgi:hypothetical protein
MLRKLRMNARLKQEINYMKVRAFVVMEDLRAKEQVSGQQISRDTK